MYYQLPNGKVINISVEDYLSLDDIDIQNLVSYNVGEYASNLINSSFVDLSEEADPDELEDIDDHLELPDITEFFNDFFPDEEDETEDRQPSLDY